LLKLHVQQQQQQQQWVVLQAAVEHKQSLSVCTLLQLPSVQQLHMQVATVRAMAVTTVPAQRSHMQHADLIALT
jgi:hypothetical protein